MILKDNESIFGLDSSSSHPSFSSSEEEQEHLECALEGNLLVFRRLLGSVVRKGEETQR